MKKKLMALMILMVSVVVIVAGCGTTSCPEIGKKAPDFTSETMNGGSVSLSDFQGKPVIMNFWSTRCGPCVMEMPHLQDVHDKLSGQGLVVLAINVSDSASVTKEFVNGQGFTFPVVMDSQMEIFEQYCLPQAIPITIFVNSEGIIKATKVGAFQSSDEIEDMLDSL